ncbi:hypothetical protein F8388_026632 [Cannabis sativa]|uniref:S-protein homolog n=1 Tax=Cannabis sativa TaxID=3483 RepID=A0A7J6EAK9_CANSA|nr:hypothetical protein F8388_026632 [Cannabis sativa]
MSFIKSLFFIFLLNIVLIISSPYQKTTTNASPQRRRFNTTTTVHIITSNPSSLGDDNNNNNNNNQAIWGRFMGSWHGFQPKRDLNNSVFWLIKPNGFFLSWDNSTWVKKALWETE